MQALAKRFTAARTFSHRKPRAERHDQKASLARTGAGSTRPMSCLRTNRTASTGAGGDGGTRPDRHVPPRTDDCGHDSRAPATLFSGVTAASTPITQNALLTGRLFFGGRPNRPGARSSVHCECQTGSRFNMSSEMFWSRMGLTYLQTSHRLSKACMFA